MTLREAIGQYIAWRRAQGARFQSQAYALRRYCRSVGDAVDCDAVRSDQVSAFLASGTPASSNRVFLYCTLASFYRYAITRSLATRSPLPVEAPKAPPSAPPYIYSRDELRRLLDAVKTYRKRVNQLEPHTFRALLLVLYGAGLRRAACGYVDNCCAVPHIPTGSTTTGEFKIFDPAFRAPKTGNSNCRRRKEQLTLTIPAHHVAQEYVDAYLEAARIGEDRRGPLFRSCEPGRREALQMRGMSRMSALKMIKRRARKAGLPAEICAHSFRGTGITEYLRNGGDLEVAARIAGHESTRTTQLYNRLREEISLDKIERIHI